MFNRVEYWQVNFLTVNSDAIDDPNVNYSATVVEGDDSGSEQIPVESTDMSGQQQITLVKQEDGTQQQVKILVWENHTFRWSRMTLGYISVPFHDKLGKLSSIVCDYQNKQI